MSSPDQGSTNPHSSVGGIAPSIRALLACPKCRGAVADDIQRGALVCRHCQLAFPVRDGIPVMLIDSATAAPT